MPQKGAPKKVSTKEELIKKAIQAFENKLDKRNVTVGEFVKLIELEKELGGSKPKEIKITWVDPKPSSEE
jgi:hypothetical protein